MNSNFDDNKIPQSENEPENEDDRNKNLILITENPSLIKVDIMLVFDNSNLLM